MNTWFVLATISPLLWAICNQIDKVLLEKYFKVNGVGTLIIVSALASIIATPFLYMMNPSVLDMNQRGMEYIILAAVLDVVLLWSYLCAMEKDDPSNVVFYYQLVPVFGIVTGWLFLGEIINNNQMIAMAIVIFGTSIISFDKIEGKFKFKLRTVGFMFLACSCWAAELAIFKKAALVEEVWRSLFWKHIVLVVLGMLLYSLVPKYRASFHEAIHDNSFRVLSINLLNESLYMAAAVLYGLAVMSAPVAVVLLTETFQSVFIFLIAIFLMRFIPKLSTEEVTRKHALKKSIAILITGVGTYLLLTS